MAHNQFTGHVGAVNNLVLQNGRYGIIQRARVKPTNPKTPAQTAQRNAVASLADVWKHLSESERANWNLYAGQVMAASGNGSLTGFMLFVKINSARRFAGDADASTVPQIPAESFRQMTVDITAATVATLTFTVTCNPALGVAETINLFVWATPCFSPGRFQEFATLRRLVYKAGVAAAATSIFTEYNTRFGAPQVGKKLTVAIVQYNEGVLGTTVQATKEVA